MDSSADLLPAVDFDREPDIEELVRDFDPQSLQAVLQAVLGTNAGMRDVAGRLVLGNDGGAGSVCWPVCGELEAIGYICAVAEQNQVQGVARLVELLIRATLRYQRAAALHLNTVREDYLELQRRHSALQESESRYRQLAQDLEQRVQDQVQALEVAQRRLYQAEKLRSVGQLAAGVAHEINNPIGFVKSNLSAAQSYVQRLGEFARHMRERSDAEELRLAWTHGGMDELLQDFDALLKESLDGAGRVARIVADLKGFSRIDKHGGESADVNEIVRGVCNVAGPLLGGQARVVLNLTPLPSLYCDAAALGQVFYNLILNATEAMGDKGTVLLATRCENAEIRIRIEDEGSGIPAEVLSRIFEPFYTTKPVGQGTGLGLALSSDVVHAHGGRIEVESLLGRGSVFSVFLPVRADSDPG